MKQKELIFYLVGKKFRQSMAGMVPFDESIIDRGRAVFDAIQFNCGKFIDVEDHFERTYSHARIIGVPLDKKLSKSGFIKELKRLRPAILKYFGENVLLKIEIIASKQANVFLRVVPIFHKWPSSKQCLVLAAIQHRYLLQNIKYCGRYAEPMIIADLARGQVDGEINECLFYSRVGTKGREMFIALEATNSAFFVIDTKNRLWCAKSPEVLYSTSHKIIEKIVQKDIKDPFVPKKEKISAIMRSGFPIGVSGYEIKEMFSSGAVRFIMPVRKLVFVDVRGKGESGIVVRRSRGRKDITTKGDFPISRRLYDRFQKEVGLCKNY